MEIGRVFVISLLWLFISQSNANVDHVCDSVLGGRHENMCVREAQSLFLLQSHQEAKPTREVQLNPSKEHM